MKLATKIRLIAIITTCSVLGGYLIKKELENIPYTPPSTINCNKVQPLKKGDKVYFDSSKYNLEDTLKSKENIVFYITSSKGCIWCDVLDSYFNQHPEILNNLDILVLDWEKDGVTFDKLKKEKAVEAIPTLKFYKKGKLVGLVEGFDPEKIKQKIEKIYGLD